ncbi:hypothetical protein CPB83DRAFT_858500 [Crepidotus variabilis]|uniref:Uncharacterized protein n=1 Tax=Crepidotus variabilis TaxID=179855 RepID=A0A9P6JMV1_9AGAR|nr:hypothetical protein CPB83DRAFT_858500 [Crepidotus variabilis]
MFQIKKWKIVDADRQHHLIIENPRAIRRLFNHVISRIFGNLPSMMNVLSESTFQQPEPFVKSSRVPCRLRVS